MPANYSSKFSHEVARYVPLVLLIITIIVAVLLRTAALNSQGDYDIFLTANEPQLVNPDGYYYLNIAKEIIDKSYSTTDNKRIYPEGISRPSRPPLLSTLLATLTQITPLSLDRLGSIFPVFASLLLALPLFLFGRLLGGSALAAIGVFIGLTAPIYAGRTALGLLDTDCLNLFFPLMIGYGFYAFAVIRGPKRYLWLITALLLVLAFFQWWDMAPAVVIAFSILPLLIAIAIIYQDSSRKGRIIILLVGGIALLTIVVLDFSYILNIVKALLAKLSYITETATNNSITNKTSLTNSEQQSLPFLVMAGAVTRPFFLFFIGIAGLFMMVRLRPGIFFVLLPTILVGLLSIFAARFMIFLVPVISLGLVFFLHQLTKIIKYKPVVSFICLALIITSGWQSLAKPILLKPVFSGRVIEGMKLIKELTPENAVIYSWWDDGHLLIYYSERATLADGAYHGGQRISRLAFPFVADSYQLAANYIRFFSTYGFPGFQRFLKESQLSEPQATALLHKLLSLGPWAAGDLIANQLVTDLTKKQWLDFLFPKDSPPVYLFLDNRLFKANLQRALYSYGTWNIENTNGGKTLPTLIFGNVFIDSNGKVASNNLHINYADGSLSFPQIFQSALFLGSINSTSGSTPPQTYNYVTTQNSRIVKPQFNGGRQPGLLPHLNANEGRYNLEILPDQNKILLQDEKISGMLSQQLFFQAGSLSTPYFTLIAEDPANYQIWQVQGDLYLFR